MRVATEPACPAPAGSLCSGGKPGFLLLSWFLASLPLGLANEPCGVFKAPSVPTFPTSWVPRGEPRRGERLEGVLPTKPQMIHIPILSQTRAEVMQHDVGRGASRGSTVPSPLPAGAAVGMSAGAFGGAG